MGARSRTLVTLLVLAGLVLLSAVWGWGQVTKPFPGRVESAPCVTRTLDKGEKIFPQDILVNVLNAGERNGLAGTVLKQLQAAGFTSGVTRNAPGSTEVAKVEIWSKLPGGPDTQLLKSWFGPDTKVVARGGQYPGLVVVVGDEFHQLLKGKKSLRASGPATICSPPL
jgi:hypothetical protein